MSTTTTVDEVASSPSCRILILATSMENALSFIASVHKLSADQKHSTAASSSSPTHHTIPWYISNKYYTANAHFEAHDVGNWTPDPDVQSVPAVVFLWAEGEDYKDHVKRVGPLTTPYESDVSIAVRVPSENGGKDEDDDNFIDEFMSTNGFEFIDACPVKSEDSNGIPRLPRVIDALSTVMWPTMHAKPYPREQPRSTAFTLLDWSGSGSFGSVSMQDEFEGWFGGYDHSFPVRVSSSPVSTVPPVRPRPLRGFDDDFTVFVSPAAADAAPPAPEPGKGTEDLSIDSSEGDGSGLWAPSHSYRSLGSGSEFGEEGEEEEEEEEEEGNDDEAPTMEEVRAMSSRLFGSDDPFDMGRVMKEVNEMRAEIAKMEDDGERRKTAACVAFGLAYGMEGR